jgi:hypothetical protein
LVITGLFFQTDKPHGFLCGAALHIVLGADVKEKQWYEAVNTVTELESHREYYDNIISKSSNKFMKEATHPFHSFDSFVESHRCKCGKHGLDDKQPYLGEALCQQ